VLSVALWDGFPDRRPYVTHMYDQAVRLYPGDYVLQSVGAIVFLIANRPQDSLACASAALSLRPKDIEGRLRVADAQLLLGHLVEAVESYRICVAVDPGNAEAHYGVGLCLLQLGDRAGALESLTRSLELADDPARRPDLLSARFYAGKATREELESTLAREPVQQAMLTYMFPLLDHPDPAKRDIEFVLRILAEREQELAGADWTWVPKTVALVRSGDWAGASAAMQGHFAQPSLFALTPSAFDFIRALIAQELGRKDAALECYERGLAQWNDLTRADPTRWEKSDVMRWRKEAEAALGM